MIVGHVGDGNFHTFVSINSEDPVEMQNFANYSQSLVNHALDLEGTCTGEVSENINDSQIEFN